MSEFLVKSNERIEWSRITDSTILKPGDALRLLGAKVDADLAVLDAHDPREEAVEEIIGSDAESEQHPEAAIVMGFMRNLITDLTAMDGTLPAHHHVLVRFRGSDEVLSTGMFVGHGEPSELLFGHVTVRYQADDQTYNERLHDLHTLLESDDSLGMYFMSDHEDISTTPQGAAYLGDDGGLKR